MKADSSWLTALLLFRAVVGGSAASAAQTYRSTGETAYAQWYAEGPCGSGSFSIRAFENRTQEPPGAPVLENAVQVFTFGFDTCTWMYSGRQGTLNDADVQMTSGTSRASASGEIELCEVFSPPFDCRPVQFHVEWTGEGEVFRNTASILNFGFGHYFSKGTTVSRAATARGIILDGGESLVPGPFTWGNLFSNGFHNFWKGN